MIKCEVVFEKNKDHIFFGRYIIAFDSYVDGNPCMGYSSVNIYRVKLIEETFSSERIFKSIGEAMYYCMGNSK